MMGSRLPRGLLWFTAVFTAAAIAGCAPVKVQPLVLPDKEEKIEREAPAPHKSVYGSRKDDLTVSSPIVRPTTVAPGDRLSCQVRYVLLSDDAKKEFKVIDVVTLSGPGGLLIELSRKTYKKPRGSHVSNLEFPVPPGLNPGSYQLTSTIRAAGREKHQQCSFTVKSRQE
jgi:hypothetical protein